jgi:hemin uptake protein HemP
VVVVPRAEQGGELAKEVDSDPTRAGPKDEERETPRVLVQTLLRGRREVILEHNGQEYRLRVTASGKLILTK